MFHCTLYDLQFLEVRISFRAASNSFTGNRPHRAPQHLLSPDFFISTAANPPIIISKRAAPGSFKAQNYFCRLIKKVLPGTISISCITFARMHSRGYQRPIPFAVVVRTFPINQAASSYFAICPFFSIGKDTILWTSDYFVINIVDINIINYCNIIIVIAILMKNIIINNIIIYNIITIIIL